MYTFQVCCFRRELGYFTRVAQIVGGEWLGWWIVAAAAISQIGQFEVCYLLSCEVLGFRL